MRRLFLLCVLCLVVWYYFPETRAILFDLAEPAVVPVIRWGTEEEMRQVARNVVEHERLTGEMPSGALWLDWLDYRYSGDEIKRDPWGSVYQLETSSDSVWVLSLGQDRIRATPDDFRVSAPRG